MMDKLEVWEVAAPEEQGMDPRLLTEMEQTMRANDMRSCLILKNGTKIFEYYRSPEMMAELNKINSCTKSILSALVGLALDQGLLPDLHTPISKHFPTLARAKDRRKRDITLDHLLAMTAGFRWVEYRKHVSYPAMIRSDDWVKYTLQQPLAADPGESMVYNSGCSHLLAAILEQASGMRLVDYARRYLFEPLGIAYCRWDEDPQGMNIGGFGLHLTTRDMAKFGQLYLNQGQWNGQSLLNEAWVKDTTAPLYLTYEHIGHYGRHWWVSSFAIEDKDGGRSRDEPYYFALGYGGQYIIVIPGQQTVVVLTNDNHKRNRDYYDYMGKYIIPALL